MSLIYNQLQWHHNQHKIINLKCISIIFISPAENYFEMLHKHHGIATVSESFALNL